MYDIQYCSRECLVANWPAHERECDIHARARKKDMEEQDVES